MEALSRILEALAGSQLLLLGAALLLAVIGYALVKRLLKLALFLLVFLAIYAGLLWVMGKPLPF